MSSKRVYLLRHGQAEHNVADDYSIHDAVLTPLGRQQCLDFAQANPDFQNVPDVILTSPFRRTLSTTLLAVPKTFQRLLPQGKILLLPQLQETHDYPCDTGSDREVLEQIEEFKNRGFDWSPLADDWNKNQGFYAPTPEALAARARWVRRFVRDRPETDILLIGHGGIFREIDGRMRSSDSEVKASLSRWGNVECRVYTFKSDDDDDAVLVPVEEPLLIHSVSKPIDSHVEIEFNWNIIIYDNSSSLSDPRQVQIQATSFRPVKQIGIPAAMDEAMTQEQANSLGENGGSETVSLPSQITSLIEACAHTGSSREAIELKLNEIVLQTDRVDVVSREGLDSSISDLSSLSAIFNLYFENTQDPWYILQGIRCQTRVIALLPSDYEERTEQLYNLGASYHKLSKRLGSLDDTNRSIEYLNQVVSLTPDAHPEASYRLTTLATAYSSRFRLAGEEQDLNEAINFHTRAVTLARGEDAIIVSLNNISTEYTTRYQTTGNVEDLDLSINHMEQAIQLASDDYPHLTSLLGNIGHSHLLRFQNTRNPEHLRKSASSFSRALALTPSGDPNIPRILDNLGSLYGVQFDHLGRQEDLTMSIEYHTQAISMMPEDHPYIYPMIANLATAHKRRFESTGEVNAINQAISYQDRLILATSPDNPDMHRKLNILGDSYLERFNRLGDIDDINQAIKYLHQAVKSTPKHHFQLLPHMSRLGSAYRTRFEHFGQLSDLNASLEWLQKVISATHTGDPKMPSYLDQIGNIYMTRFEHGGEPKDVATALNYLRQAVSLTPKDLPEYKRFNDLGYAYSVNFECFGKIEDIDKSIELLDQGLALIPQGHPDISTSLNNLGKSYALRFERLKRSEDNKKAISLLSRALDFIPQDSPELRGQLNNLSASYLARFEQLNRQEDIDKAIELLIQAVPLFHDGHPNLPGVLNQLGLSYWTRFNYGNEIKDIDESLPCLERALSLLPVGHRDIPALLNSLCIAHLARFREIRSAHDIDCAQEFITRALSLIPDGHPDVPGLLLNFGQVHQSRFEILGELDSLNNCLDYFKQTAESKEGVPFIRLQAARLWANNTASDCTSERLKAYDVAMNIIPQLVWFGSTIRQRYDEVHMIEDLAVEAAAVAIQAREYALAIEWLEQGRSIVWNQVLQLRTPLDHLHSACLPLAEKLAEVASKLHHTGSRATAGLIYSQAQSPEQIAREHHRLAVEYEDLIRQAREISGLEDFLMPKKAPELMRAAHSGPIVVVNIHKSRCDALIIKPAQHDIVHLPLPKVPYVGMTNMRTKLTKVITIFSIYSAPYGWM
ncbi:unnamed protein product [Rhizoctonia solani]|uniref:Uncharacterized protein n=1 Tax=Rhizoctonia solani TaxID=456999 RepID=A0A8H3GDG0_9AGAM|nr:unnamed protein product [Rhizoctonia solani]